MRVIAGSARRLKLKTVQGMDVRPTTDRTKETLFNIIAGRLPDCRFLDLFAGSGAIGIEALSRGAKRAVFVDNHRASVDCIKENLLSTHMKEHAEVFFSESVSALGRLECSGERFDLIFMDPPYRCDLEKQVLLWLSAHNLLEPDGLIIVEAALDTSFEYLGETRFKVTRSKEYLTNKHVMIEIQ